MQDTIDVYALDLDRGHPNVDRLASLLDPEEAERAGQFRWETDRRRYIVRHGLLRELLARYTGRSPQSIHFVPNDFGKPFLSDSDIQFNVSYSANICVVAIARGQQIGCDVEWRDPTFPCPDIARAFFAPREAQRLGELDPSQQVEAFFNCWTRKEAYIKARGCGVSLPLDSFEVSLAPQQPAALLKGCDGWSVQSFEPVPAFHAAVVTSAASFELSLRAD